METGSWKTQVAGIEDEGELIQSQGGGRTEAKQQQQQQQQQQQNKQTTGTQHNSQIHTASRVLGFVCLLVGCLTSQQHASVSQGRICSDKFTCCHTEIEVADQTFYLTQSQYADTGPTISSADPIAPSAWQGNHWSANF